MKSIIIKSVLSFWGLVLLLGVICNPMVVKAEEVYIYDVDLTPDSDQNLDLNKLEQGQYWARFNVKEIAEGSKMDIEIQRYLKNGFYYLDRRNNYATGEDRNIGIKEVLDADVEKVNVEYISEDNKIVVKNYFNSTGENNAVVLNDGESKTIKEIDFSKVILITHTGNPTKNEKLHQIKIKADGSVDSSRDSQWESYDYWKSKSEGEINIVEYTSPKINTEPFRSDHYDDKNNDNWWEEDSPASYVVVSYTEEDGFVIKYVWSYDEPEPEEVKKEDDDKDSNKESNKESESAPPTENQSQQVAIFNSIEKQISIINASTTNGDLSVNDANVEKKVTIDGGTLINSLPNNTLAILAQNPTVSLYFTYFYNGIKYTTCIPAGAPIDHTIEWFGPVYLMYTYPTTYLGQDNAETLFPFES